MRITETARALAHFTPESRATLDLSELSTRLGRGTVAGGLNDQVRFRFDQQGAPSTWKLVPDNELSERVLESKSGPLLQSKLQGILRPLDAPHARGLVNLQGIMLSDDEQGYSAGLFLEQEDARRLGTPQFPRVPIDQIHDMGRAVSNIASAQAINGWVHLPPDTARNVLTSIGAYTPDASESTARSAKFASQNMGPTLGHELQHRVSEADFQLPATFDVNWMEEGIPTLLAMHGRAARANAAGWNTSAASHAGHVGAPDHVDVGWKPWMRDWSVYEEYTKNGSEQSNYVDSVATLKDLLRLAKVDRRTTAGREATFDLLQGAPVDQVPARLANAILKAHDISATKPALTAVTKAIVAANETGGTKALRTLVDALSSQR